MGDLRTVDEQRVGYVEKTACICSVLGIDTVSTYDFYRDVFPDGFLQDAYAVNPDARHDGKYVAIANAIHTRKRDGGTYRRNRYVTDDLSTLLKLRPNVAFVSPCSFLGGRKDLAHLRFIHAFVVDLDYVGVRQVQNFFHQCMIGYIPTPTYVVNSGTGLHLYYVLEEPLRCYPNQQPAYAALKHALIDLCWNSYTSKGDTRQYSGLVQPYRIVGSRSKLDVDHDTQHVVSQDYPVLAWRYGGKWTVDSFLSFEPSVKVLQRWRANMVEVDRLLHPGKDPDHLMLGKAKELYPEWYDRRILHGEPPKGIASRAWRVNRAVYDRWLERIRAEGVEGHRYHCIMCLAIYALKCSLYDEKRNPNPVTWEELRRDAYSLLDHFEGLTTDETNHFTASDVEQALKAFRQPNYFLFTMKQVSYFSGIHIERNQTRKGRKQAEHLEEARLLRDFRQQRKGTNWYDNGGRPEGSKNKKHPKKEAVLGYFEQHPDASHSQAARDLGISRPTVIKWLKQEKNNQN